jgi:hypothetical protein
MILNSFSLTFRQPFGAVCSAVDVRSASIVHSEFATPIANIDSGPSVLTWRLALRQHLRLEQIPPAAADRLLLRAIPRDPRDLLVA